MYGLSNQRLRGTENLGFEKTRLKWARENNCVTLQGENRKMLHSTSEIKNREKGGTYSDKGEVGERLGELTVNIPALRITKGGVRQ